MEKKAEAKTQTKAPLEFVPTLESKVKLTQELLDQHLPEILEHFKKKQKNLELAILNQPIRVREDEVILEVMGHVQEERGNSMKPDLINVIRAVTGASNFRISLETKEEVQSLKSKLYTDSDKFNFLLDKHPALKEFRKKFGLETDL
ncbi:hypothetical protein [Algoriphagus sp. CAU 1675]|uniref:hypothetical protein n=1 Tax=Algoriphagus sp. CAU 1675 TaxID=3032597 RepID=UPI0023DBED32|nr:hypothetical protein [Algoriphagus sp. CAU 1675]MDF2157564.1 hypothetical protein [Algoriphagus sp. CAU 1675]